MLTLPIKKKWFDMILSGEKKEEYREIKPYYDKRFRNIMRSSECTYWKEDYGCPTFFVELRNGYSRSSLYIVAVVVLSIGCGRPEWGAEPNKEYYILRIKDFVRNL